MGDILLGVAGCCDGLHARVAAKTLLVMALRPSERGKFRRFKISEDLDIR
jgi:hypothetical protein